MAPGPQNAPLTQKEKRKERKIQKKIRQNRPAPLDRKPDQNLQRHKYKESFKTVGPHFTKKPCRNIQAEKYKTKSPCATWQKKLSNYSKKKIHQKIRQNRPAPLGKNPYQNTQRQNFRLTLDFWICTLRRQSVAGGVYCTRSGSDLFRK